MKEHFSKISIFRSTLFFTVFFILSFSALVAQVKVGENPQNIDDGSLLELESDQLVLVVTRVTTQQMNAMSPLEGALVYNTDIGCVYAYTGITWINLCNQNSSGGGVSIAPGNSIIDFGGAFYDNSIVQDELTETTDALDQHLIEDTDTDDENELTDLVRDGTVLRLSNPATPGNQVDLSDLAGGSNTNLANTDLTQADEDRNYNLNGRNLVFSGVGNMGISANPPQEKVHVGGNLRVDGRYLDSGGDAGTSGQLLSATAGGTDWVSPSSAFHALGKVTDGVLINRTNVGSIIDIGIGNYQLIFDIPASSDNYVVQVSLLDTGPAVIEVATQNVSGFNVRLYDLNGDPIDGTWFFSVVDF
ncbi:hypothetical protein [Maribacter sp. 2-571]|uniref:hypothetical protein n=1 Tax=Maribacter sp. 2-571 TaxID=3417569 RepID=UPI003D351264